MQSVIQIGPLALNADVLALLLATCAVYAALYGVERWRDLRLQATRRILVSTVLVFVLAFKLGPLFLRPGHFVSYPLALLHYPPTTFALVVGLAAAAGFAAWNWWRRRVESGVLYASGVLAAGLLMLLLPSLLVALVGQSNLAEGKHPSAPGLRLPVLACNSPGAKPEMIELSDFQGRFVVLNFWATWCPPCRAEIPELRDFAAEAPQDTALLAVNLTSGEKGRQKKRKLCAFVRDFRMQFPILLDHKGKAARAYQIRSVPTTVIIDREGRIRNVHTGAVSGEQLRDYIRQARKAPAGGGTQE